jgi:hypothetical protein
MPKKVELKPTNEWRAWAVCLLPRCLCVWLWRTEIPPDNWAPHIFGRMIGATGWNRAAEEGK